MKGRPLVNNAWTNFADDHKGGQPRREIRRCPKAMDDEPAAGVACNSTSYEADTAIGCFGPRNSLNRRCYSRGLLAPPSTTYSGDYSLATDVLVVYPIYKDAAHGRSHANSMPNWALIFRSHFDAAFGKASRSSLDRPAAQDIEDFACLCVVVLQYKPL